VATDPHTWKDYAWLMVLCVVGFAFGIRAPTIAACSRCSRCSRTSARPAEDYSRVVAPAKRNWIQEERRKTLGDWVAFCPTCGHTQRYFLELEDELEDCPQCGGELRHRCPSCDGPIASAFAVECEECGAAVRPPELFGTTIRKPGR